MNRSRWTVPVVVWLVVAGVSASLGAPVDDGATARSDGAVITIPPIDLDAVMREDDDRQRDGLPPRFAIPHPVSVTPDSHGIWEDIDETTRRWRVWIESPGAMSINLGFGLYAMPAGGSLRFHAEDFSQSVRPFTHEDNATHRELWTPVVSSDRVVLEVTIPTAAVEDLELELTSINIGYRGFGGLGNPLRSGSCNVDVVCPEGDLWRGEISTVGVISTGGGTFCTGGMVNNTSYDLTPYFLTASHCGIGSGNAASLVVYWNYENSWCRPPGGGASGGPGDGTLSEFNSGSFFRAGNSASDFTLVQLDSDPNPTWGVGFAGWDRSSADSSSAVTIHHPSTDEKRISFEYNATATTSYLGESVPGDGTHVRVIDWDLGTTEPGSSGSPLFNQDHRVVGQLHGGYASCTSQTSDWYGRFSVSWTGGGSASTRLSNWLDPGGTGAMNVDTISGAGMTVTPAGDVEHVGLVGGPFTNPSVVYTVSNPSPTPISFSVSLTTSFGILLNGGTVPVAGTLPGNGGTQPVTVSLGSAINSLPAGVYAEQVVFTDLTNGVGNTRAHTVEIGQTLFSVQPDTVLESGGPVGGPFGGSQVYTVTSERPSPVAVQVAASHSWIALNGGSGPMVLNLNGTGVFDTVTVGYSAAANALPAGIYTGQVTFTNLSGGSGDTSRTVILDVGRVVYPSQDTPLPINDNATTTSTIIVNDSYCVGDVDVDINITHTYIGDLTIDLTSPSGTTVRLHDRSGGSADDIVLTYDDEGIAPDGPGTLANFDLSSLTGVWTLTVTDHAGQDTGTLNSWALRIAPAGDECPTPVLVYSFPMNSNPGWTTQGQWTFGQPTGGGGEHGIPDPTAGHAGSNVYGYNLSGDYTNNMPEYHLTSTAIDCSGLTGVKLNFWRWLGVEQPAYDHAYVRVSIDGSTWVTVWENTVEVTDSSWSLQSLNIGGVADGQSTVYVRWTMGITDGSWLYCGWNIDDVEIWGVVACTDPCDDGSACTINDHCSGPGCVGTPVDCSMFGDSCNVVTCNPAGAEGNCDVVTSLPNGSSCDDGGPCAVGEACQAGVCSGGGAPDCSGAGDGCNVASCDKQGTEGNCDTLNTVIDGTPCDGGAGVCLSGVCMPDPGNTRVFMVRPGSEVSAPTSGPTSITMAPGQTTTIEVWVAETTPDLLGSYQISIPGIATPMPGATGSVSYTDNPDAGGGDSVYVDVSDPQWVFYNAGSPPTPYYSETGIPMGFAFLAGMDPGSGMAVDGLGYMGRFQFTASTDALGTFTLTFIPDGQPPNGGSGMANDASTGPIYAAYQPLEITVSAGQACNTADDCGDLDLDGVTDDVCMWWECLPPNCGSVPKVVPADMGGSFGACPLDGFCNIHDRNHALLCFAGENACDTINVDAGGSFGACAPDGFCNIHDANHALTCFAGANGCACTPSPEAHDPVIVDAVSLSVVTDRRAVSPGGEVSVRVFVDDALEALQSYQLHLAATGGRRGTLDLVNIAIENRRDHVFSAVQDTFDAFNSVTSQMLSGLSSGDVATRRGGYLATYTYRASPDAVGAFVVDVLRDEAGGDQTFMVASFTDRIALDGTTPAVIVVAGNRASGVR